MDDLAEVFLGLLDSRFKTGDLTIDFFGAKDPFLNNLIFFLFQHIGLADGNAYGSTDSPQDHTLTFAV
jgi:hypothetical protein